MDDGDRHVRQFLAWVQRNQLGVVPLADLAQEHFGQHRAAHAQLALAKAFQVEHWHGATNDGGELHHAVAVEVFALDRCVSGAESNRLGADLADTARRTDGLVVQANTGVFFVGFSPLGVNGEWERGASAGDVGSQGRTHGDGSKRGSSHGLEQGTLGVHVSPLGC